MDELAVPVTPPAPSGPFDGTDADALEREVDDVERALARLAEGTYGTCEVCGTRLDTAVLEERPAARLCAAHLPMATA